MSALIVEDDAWKAILADPALARARKHLSMDEIRTIVRHAQARPPLGSDVVKLTADKVPYSSVVGGGLMLKRADGSAGFIVNFMGTTQGITKAETAALSERFAWFVNNFGCAVPARPTTQGE
jgi:hypothetical protein